MDVNDKALACARSLML